MPQLSKSASSGRSTRPDEVKIWDLALRLFHWSLLAAFVFAWVSADNWDRAHELSGYVIAALIGFRLFWGFAGSKHARFRDFVTWPKHVISYLKDIRSGTARRYLGHNPAGGMMILALLASLIGLSASGYAMTSNMFWGVEWVEQAHEIAANATLMLAALHVAGVIISSLAHRENLVKAMITGRKRRNDD